MSKYWLSWLLAVVLVFFNFVIDPVWAADSHTGEQIFQTYCAGCHINGSNIIRRGKNLRSRALKRNGYDTKEAIAALVTNGKNNMSAYSDRLSAAEIEAVSIYVLKQAEAGWK